MNRVSLRRETALAVRLAEEAGALLLRRFRRGVRVRHKGEIDLVTDADRAAEALVYRRLRRERPLDDILSEETLGRSTGTPRRWIVDPLDGTTNFSQGLPQWCVSIALEVDGIVVAGAVHDPLHDETFRAARGEGAFLGRKRVAAAARRRLERAVAVTGFPYDLHERPGRAFERFEKVAGAVLAVRRFGSAALDFCAVAAGRFDIFWERGLHPWDVAAGTLIVQEAGGRVTQYDGRPLRLDSPDVLATNGHLHAAMLRCLR